MRHIFRLASARTAAFFVLFCSFLLPQIRAQHAVDPSMRYFRVVALVHLNGSGKKGDPILPEYVPTTSDPTRQGILSWSMQISDDGKMAVIQMVAANHAAFNAILADKRPEVKVFEIGKDSTDKIQGELKKYISTFDLTQFRVVAQ